jgi:sugar lactone lactonase YvrE
MGTLALSRFALSISAAAALLAGCGGSQPPIAISQSRASTMHAERDGSWMLQGAKSSGLRPTYNAKSPLLYVTNSTAAYNDVRVYRAKAKNATPLATISDDINTPTGACIDGEGTLYVVNEPNNSNGWISEYQFGKTTPSRTIRDGIDVPAFCAIDGSGNLWVTNIGARNVTEYLSGSKKPHTVITQALTFPVGIAFDADGNLFVGNGWDAAQPNVEVYSRGSKSPSRTITDGVTWPVGITVDSKGTLYVTNAAQNNIAEYRSGQSYPFQTITKAMNAPVGLTVNKSLVLYVANLGGNNVVEFPPGSVNPLKRQISKGLYNPQGISYFPPLLPSR